ncbi:MAG: hypothetical protein RLZZ241_276 [Bacteroidota bacterium]|jgi:hypothetical protein
MGKRKSYGLSQKGFALKIIVFLLIALFFYFMIGGNQYETALAKLLVLLLIFIFVGYSLQK